MERKSDIPRRVSRRSIFEDVNTQQPGNGSLNNLPEEPSEIRYSEEYIEKVKSEIEEWKMQIQSILTEAENFKKETNELKNTVIDESVLSEEQKRFFELVNLDGYMQCVEDFSVKSAIFANTALFKPESEVEQWHLTARRKIEREFQEKL